MFGRKKTETSNLILAGDVLLRSVRAFASVDLGRKVGEEDRFKNRTDFEYDRAGQLVNVKRSGAVVSGSRYRQGCFAGRPTPPARRP